MRLVTIAEFKRLCCLSDRALVWLIERNLLELIPGEHTPTVNLENVKVKDLIKALSTRSDELCSQNGSWIEERVASVCVKKLEELLDLALSQSERF